MEAISKFEVNNGRVLFRFVGKGRFLRSALRQAIIMHERQKEKADRAGNSISGKN